MLAVKNSARLSFEFVTPDDREFLHAIDQDEEVMRYLNGGKKTTWQELDEQFMPRIAAFSDQDKGWGLWKVCVNAESGRPVGWILVRPFGFFTGNPQPENLELGWRFCRDSWGKGYASEAATAVMAALKEKGCEQFCAIALEANTASTKVMQKLGMRYVRTERYKDAIFDDDVVVYQTTGTA